MADKFARTTATEAHKRATAAARDATEALELVRSVVGEPRIVGRCCLCGDPTARRYCRAHEWAAT